MPIPTQIREELQRRRLSEHRGAERDKLWDFVRTGLQCLASSITGLALIAWSFHSSDPPYARVIFWSGLGVGNAGILLSILGLYRRGEARGDW